ncbi:hypothetical protein [Ralstonia solanacearum]|uniref:hypothetical protein n=1 Tax=Ralstonia solanacearum TaxID=305 RepID=UPI001300DC12|nr:hypothetical protein [Ralstonia solanacearum]
MTKKTRKRSSTSDSSSSRTTAHSEAPSEILALGARLVRELKLEPGVDTLGRWMAHHLAELLEKERSTKGKERKEAQDRVVELILKLWSRREDLPGNANPLKRYEHALTMLDRLQTDCAPFYRPARGDFEGVLIEAFGRFNQLILFGMLLSWPQRPNDVDLGEAGQFLDPEEKRFADALAQWLRSLPRSDANLVRVVITSENDSDVPAHTEERTQSADPESIAKAELSENIDRLVSLLTKLKTMLPEQAAGDAIKSPDSEDDTSW